MNDKQKSFVIDRSEPSRVLIQARNLAGSSLEKLFREHSLNGRPSPNGFRWIKSEWTFPSFEHFTFAYKNQIFPVFVELLVNGESIMLPNERIRFLDASRRYNLVPCVYKVDVAPQSSFVKTKSEWFGNGTVCKSIPNLNKPAKMLKPYSDGWNLFDLRNGKPINPEEIGTDERIKMSEWELLNFACQIVRG